jgi:hypothetical protein
MPCLWYIFRLLAHTLVRTRMIPNPKDRVLQWHIQFSFKMAGFHWATDIYFTQFRWIFKELYRFPMENMLCCTLLSCVLNWCVFLCVTTRKPQNLEPANLYNIVDKWNVNREKFKVWQFDFLNNKYKYTCRLINKRCALVFICIIIDLHLITLICAKLLSISSYII